MDITIHPVRRLRGTLRVPGDKSISHRGLLLGAMAKGRSRIEGLAPGQDVASTLASLRILGADVEPAGEGRLEVDGPGWEVSAAATLDAGNSATTMRLLAGALAGRSGAYVLAGDGSLSGRPMDRVATPLRRMGARVALIDDRYPPIRLQGGPLVGISYRLPMASAQVKGAILLAGLQAAGATRIAEPAPSRDHTERLLAWLGVPVSSTPAGVELSEAGDRLPLPAFDLTVPGDLSSAAFFIVAACLVPGSDLRLVEVSLNPSRTGLVDVLASMGAAIEVEPQEADPEPRGAIRARSAQLSATEIDGELIPRTIDELPLAALAATQAEGVTIIRDAAELRVKESDRLAVLARGLRSLGADVAESPDGLCVSGPTPLTGGVVDPHGDHRLALAFAVAGMIGQAPVTIAGWECTHVSFPGFLEAAEGIAR